MVVRAKIVMLVVVVVEPFDDSAAGNRSGRGVRRACRLHKTEGGCRFCTHEISTAEPLCPEVGGSIIQPSNERGRIGRRERDLAMGGVAGAKLRDGPGAGNDGVGLEEFEAGAGAHLGGDDAEEVVLEADDVDGRHGAVLDDEFQRPGEGLFLFPFPVEILADLDAVELERRLGEEGRDGLGLEIELVVERAAVVDLALAVADLLRSGAVGDDLEGDLGTGQDADLDFRLLPDEAPEDELFGLFGNGDFVDHFAQDLRGQTVEVGGIGQDEVAGHVGAAGADGEMVLARGEVVVGPARAAQDHQGPVFAVGVPGEGVEARLPFPGQERRAVQQAVEHLGHRLGGRGAEGEDAAGVVPVVEELGVLDGGDVFEVRGDRLRDGMALGLRDDAEQAVHRAFEGHVALAGGLEVEMVRDGGAGLGTVIEDDAAGEVGRHVEHVDVAVPDRLGLMDVPHDDEMLREDRETVDDEVVLAVLAALELDEMLVLGAMVRAERAGPGGDDLGRDVGGRAADAVGIALDIDQQAAERHLPHPHALQRAERRRHLGPDGQLVVHELVYFLLGRHIVCINIQI